MGRILLEIQNLYNYLVNTIKAAIDTVKTNVDTANTNINTTKTNVTNLDTKIGPASPSSGGTDTVFKYLKVIYDTIYDFYANRAGTPNPTGEDRATIFNFLNLIQNSFASFYQSVYSPELKYTDNTEVFTLGVAKYYRTRFPGSIHVIASVKTEIAGPGTLTIFINGAQGATIAIPSTTYTDIDFGIWGLKEGDTISFSIAGPTWSSGSKCNKTSGVYRAYITNVRVYFSVQRLPAGFGPAV